MPKPDIITEREPGVYRATRPGSGVLPLVFDSPHSGTVFPPDFQPAVPRESILHCADLYVDRLFSSASEFGAVLLSADFPRVYIDPNRADDDIDPAQTPDWSGPANPSEKTRLGKGLVWRTVKPKATPLYDRPLSGAEIMSRIASHYRPYHDVLDALTDAAHRATGAVWHVNCHSMQPVSAMIDAEGPEVSRPDIVLSDRDGTTSDRDFLMAAKASFADQGLKVSINNPFKGAEIVRRHGRPDEGRHSIQVEINRKLYLNLQTLEPNPHFAETKATVDRFILDLVGFVNSRGSTAHQNHWSKRALSLKRARLLTPRTYRR